MTALIAVYDRLAARAAALAEPVLPTLARLVFAGVLLVYYWGSATTKLGDGPLSPSLGAYLQIFPKAVEAAGFDLSQLTVWHSLVVLAGTAAEFVLPALIVLGLFTRLAALGMIGFVAVQSYVDVTGHGLAGADIGAWFDRDPSGLLLDQRAFWFFLLLVLAVAGGGPASVDRWLSGQRRMASP